MEEGNSVAEEWHTYKGGKRSFDKLGDTTSHPEALKTATHIRVDASNIATSSFYRFRALVAVDLLPGLQEIGDRAFQYCSNLQLISIPLTVQVIGIRSFQACSSLQTVTIPKSTNIIRIGAFSYCSVLTTINLPKDGTLEVLEDFLFAGSTKLKAIHVPSSVKYIGKLVFKGCHQLATIELPAGILTLGKRCFCDASELSNIAIPSTVECIEGGLFESAYEIRRAILHPNGDEEDSEEDSEEDDDEDTNKKLVNAIMKRFDDLPLHKMCYYHTYYPMEKTINDIHSHSEDSDEVDMFGMTSLHVLALSTEPKTGLFKALAKCVPPRMFTAQDKWGMTPIQYLVTSSMPGAEESTNFFIQHTILDRSQWLGLDRWKAEISNRVNLLDFSDLHHRHQQIEGLYSLLEKLELVESTSLVESVLWTIIINEAKNSSPPVTVDREVCRIHCGAETVISNVLQFLLDSSED